MAKDILGEAGLHFDELNKLRVLDPEVTQQTIELKEECKDFVDSECHLGRRGAPPPPPPAAVILARTGLVALWMLCLGFVNSRIPTTLSPCSLMLTCSQTQSTNQDKW